MVFRVENNVNHLPILYIDHKPFHSIKDPYKDKKLLVINDLSKKYYLLIGVGLGYVLEAFQNIKEHYCFILFFQDPKEQELFEQYKHQVVMQDLVYHTFLLKDKLKWQSFLQTIPLSQTEIWTHHYYYQLMQNTSFPILYKELQLYIKKLLMNQITDAAFGFRWWRNFLRNYFYQSTHMFKKNRDLTNDSILLIGSGLSTYKSIQYIQQYQDSYFIIAVPPVVSLLLHYHIIPDMIVMTDGGTPNRFYTAMRDKSLIHSKLIVYPHVYPLILEWFKGQVLTLNSGLEPEALLTPELETSYSGGSVASTALDIALQLSSNIEYIGFDFAYTDSHPHYPGSPLEENSLFMSDRFHSTEKKFANQLYTPNNLKINHQITSPVLKAYQEYFTEQINKAHNNSYHIKELDINNPIDISIRKNKTTFDLNFNIEIPYNIKRDRLKVLKEKLEQDINKESGEANSLFKLIGARAHLKSKPLKPILQKEINFLTYLLEDKQVFSQSFKSKEN